MQGDSRTVPVLRERLADAPCRLFGVRVVRASDGEQGARRERLSVELDGVIGLSRWVGMSECKAGNSDAHANAQRYGEGGTDLDGDLVILHAQRLWALLERRVEIEAPVLSRVDG